MPMTTGCQRVALGESSAGCARTGQGRGGHGRGGDRLLLAGLAFFPSLRATGLADTI